MIVRILYQFFIDYMNIDSLYKIEFHCFPLLKEKNIPL